jgi:hypothetical protein
VQVGQKQIEKSFFEGEESVQGEETMADHH